MPSTDKNMKTWLKRALDLLEISVSGVAVEVNEIDWKSDLSGNNKRMAEHLSAFANLKGGGYLVFGVDDHGAVVGLTNPNDAGTIMSKLDNVARQGLEPALKLDHQVVKYRGKSLLIVFVEESLEKPVHLRGKGYEAGFIRSAGHTRKMSKLELGHALMNSKVPKFEDLEAHSAPVGDLLNQLEVEAYYKLRGRPVPKDEEVIVHDLLKAGVFSRHNSGYAITNLGVLLCAKNTEQFPGHERRGVRFIIYNGKTRSEVTKEHAGHRGYAVAFRGLVRFVLDRCSTDESIRDGIRTQNYLFPEIAIRELIANALIHQDLTITTTSPLIELFDDRLEITSPGRLLPDIQVERLMDTHPESRNERFAKAMRHLGICEERGSGIDRAVEAVENAGLPPIAFKESASSFKATIYARKKYKDMTQQERILAVYQHCCLKFVGNEKLTNASLRARLGISESNYPMVSRIIKDAVNAKKIKPADEGSRTRKFAAYVPYWA